MKKKDETLYAIKNCIGGLNFTCVCGSYVILDLFVSWVTHYKSTYAKKRDFEDGNPD